MILTERFVLLIKKQILKLHNLFRARNNLILSYTISAFHLYSIFILQQSRNVPICHVYGIYLHLPKVDLEAAPRYSDRNELGKVVPRGCTDVVVCNRACTATMVNQRTVRRLRNRKRSQIRTSLETDDSIRPAEKGPLSLPTLLPHNEHSSSHFKKERLKDTRYLF